MVKFKYLLTLISILVVVSFVGCPMNNPPETPSTPSGPSTGNINTSYTFSSSATDPDGDKVAITFDWGNGKTSSWSSYTSSGSSVSMSHSYSSEGTYYVKAKAKDKKDEESDWSSGHSITIAKPNTSPNTPSTPSGSSSGKVGTSYTFSSSTTDSDGDKVALKFDWGDGKVSSWSSYVSSGSSVSASHSYSSAGTYYIKAKAKDIKGSESNWSSGHKITISTEQVGQRLYYDDGSMEDGAYVESGDLGWLVVRFTRPSGWSATRITKVKVYIYDNADYPFGIDGFDDYEYLGGYYWPSGDWITLKENTYQSIGWYEHTVNYTFYSKEFFIGIWVSNLEGQGAPALGVDEGVSCAVRSYLLCSEGDYIFTEVDWGIRIYVEKPSFVKSVSERIKHGSNDSKKTKIQGMWLSPSGYRLIDSKGHPIKAKMITKPKR